MDFALVNESHSILMTKCHQDQEYIEENVTFITKSKKYLLTLKKHITKLSPQGALEKQTNLSSEQKKLTIHSQLIHFLYCLQSAHEYESLFDWVQQYWPHSQPIPRDSLNLEGSSDWKILFEYVLKGYGILKKSDSDDFPIRPPPPFLYLHAYLTERDSDEKIDVEDDEKKILHDLLAKYYLHPEELLDSSSLLEWKNSFRELREMNAFEDDKNLKTLVSIFCGDNDVIKQVGHDCGLSWFQIVIAILNYSESLEMDVDPQDFKNDFEKTLYFLWNLEDCNRLFGQNSFDPWFSCHFADLLYEAGLITKETRDDQFNKYGELIFADHWRISMDYIQDFNKKQNLIKNVNVESMQDWIRVHYYCTKNNLDSDAILKKLTEKPNFSGLLLSKKNQDEIVTLCRDYVTGKKDTFEEFDFLRRIKAWERDDTSCSVKALFDSPKMIWILILKKIMVYLKTKSLSQGDVTFVMTKLEDLKSHQSDEYFWYLLQNINAKGFSQKELENKKDGLISAEIKEMRLCLVNHLSRSIIY